MKQVVQNYQTGELRLVDVPAPALQPEGVLVGNRYSVVSAGTERMKVEQASLSLLGKAKARPDQVRKVIDHVQRHGILDTYQRVTDRLDSLTPLGYSSAGVVSAVGTEATEFSVGDRVACAGAGYANHAEVVFVPRNLCVRIPDSVAFDAAAFTTVGAIALQGVRQAGSTVGETVAVIGLGLVGQLCAQLLKAAGCRVIGVDLVPRRVELAVKCGIDIGLSRDEADIRRINELTCIQGVDAVLVAAATTSNDPLSLAAEICRDRGRIVVVGAIKVEIPNTLKSHFYEKELELFMSRSYGPGRYDPTYEKHAIDYPVGYVRWTAARNMVAFLDLLAAGKIDVSSLISYRFAFADAQEAYRLLTEKSTDTIGLLLDYGNTPMEKASSQVWLRNSENTSVLEDPNVVRVGLIGAGNHARAKVIPALRDISSVELRGIATTSGISARDAADKYSAAFATSDYRDILTDPDADCVVISTRHNTHAAFTSEALRASKHVFVEKPLALSIDELREIVLAQQSSSYQVCVGFNRRFASHSQHLQAFFRHKTGPLTAIYRINAEYQDPSVWYQDPVEGGNRIVGECGHFVDLLSYVLDALPTQVYTAGIPDPALPAPDNVSITLNFSDASVATILYTASGDTSMPKERLEVFGQGRMGILNDFRTLTLSNHGKKRTYKDRFGQDKGHVAEMRAFIAVVQGKEPWPISAESQVLTTLATILALESLRENRPLPVDLSWVLDKEDA